MEWAAGDLVPGLVRGIRVILKLRRVSITTLIDLVAYVICSRLRCQPLSDLISFGNKSIPEMPRHWHAPQPIPEVWVTLAARGSGRSSARSSLHGLRRDALRGV
jgi:hypothetical protein